MEARRMHYGSWEVKTPAYTGPVTNEQDDSYRWLLGRAVLCQALHQTPPDPPWAPAWLYVALECCWIHTVKSQICLLQWSCSWLASIMNKIIQLSFWKITRSAVAVKHGDSSKVGCLIFLPYFQCLFPLLILSYEMSLGQSCKITYPENVFFLVKGAGI